MRTLPALIAAAASAGLLAACASAPTGSSPRVPARSPAPAPSRDGLLPASPELAGRLVLSQTRVAAGTPIDGTLVVTNHGPAINLTRGCRPGYAVVLTSRRIQPDVAWPLICSPAPFIIARGVTRLRFTVMTTYRGCLPSGDATDLVPACLHRGTASAPPPLPPGRYTAVLVGDGQLALPAPVPVPVTLTGGAPSTGTTP